MENETEINIVDVRNIRTDIATVSIQELTKLYKNANSILDSSIVA